MSTHLLTLKLTLYLRVQRVEREVTSKHIETIEKLFEHFEDLNARNSGLERAIADNGELAWVCGTIAAEEGNKATKSTCYREFFNKGHRCIAVAMKYV